MPASESGSTPSRLVAYLDALRIREADNPRASGLVALGRSVVPARWRPRLKSSLSRIAMVRSRRQAARLLASGVEIKLHLGCGEVRLPGWVNVDLVGTGGADFIWDLARPLPFPDGSISAIFHEHLLEHLTYWQGLYLFQECRRLLKPGGVLRLGVPDFGRYARDYALHTGFIQEIRPAAPTALLGMAEVAYCYQHVSMWDAETLLLMFSEMGFVQSEARTSGSSRFTPAPDAHYRRPETLYVEGLRAGGVLPQAESVITPSQEPATTEVYA